MKINIKTKANIDKKHPELCSWNCPHHSLLEEGITIANCMAYLKQLEFVTLPNGKEMLKRCRQCLANVIGGSSGIRNRKG